MPEPLRISPCLCNLVVCQVFPFFGVQEIKYYGRICHSQLVTCSLCYRISQCYFYYFINLACFFYLVTMYGCKFNKEKHLKLVILYIQMLYKFWIFLSFKTYPLTPFSPTSDIGYMFYFFPLFFTVLTYFFKFLSLTVTSWE